MVAKARFVNNSPIKADLESKLGSGFFQSCLSGWGWGSLWWSACICVSVPASSRQEGVQAVSVMNPSKVGDVAILGLITLSK